MVQNPPAALGARNPGKQIQNNVIDCGQDQDNKYYKMATEKLNGDPYDGKNLMTFL